MYRRPQIKAVFTADELHELNLTEFQFWTRAFQWKRSHWKSANWTGVRELELWTQTFQRSWTEVTWTDLHRVDPVTRHVIGHARHAASRSWLAAGIEYIFSGYLWLQGCSSRTGTQISSVGRLWRVEYKTEHSICPCRVLTYADRHGDGACGSSTDRSRW